MQKEVKSPWLHHFCFTNSTLFISSKLIFLYHSYDYVSQLLKADTHTDTHRHTSILLNNLCFLAFVILFFVTALDGPALNGETSLLVLLRLLTDCESIM